MKWTVKLVAEVGQGEARQCEIATNEREDQVSPASIGLMSAEGKRPDRTTWQEYPAKRM